VGFLERLVWAMMGAEVILYALVVVAVGVFLGLFYRVLKLRRGKL